MNTSNRSTGVWLIVFSAFVFSTAGIFTNGVTTAAWDIIFWRGLAASAFTLLYILITGQLRRECQQFKLPALAVALCFAAGTAAFIPAFKLSSVANVAMIYAAAPFISALLAWVFIKEKPTRRVVVCSLLAFGGVFFIFADSIAAKNTALTGDMLTLFMTLMMASVIVIYRLFPNTTAALPAALSSVVLLPISAVMGNPFGVNRADIPVLILFGLVFALASVTLAEGAKRVPSGETALLSALETPVAPLLAFFILAEIPGNNVLLGGLIVMIAVVGSQLFQDVGPSGPAYRG